MFQHFTHKATWDAGGEKDGDRGAVRFAPGTNALPKYNFRIVGLRTAAIAPFCIIIPPPASYMGSWGKFPPAVRTCAREQLSNCVALFSATGASASLINRARVECCIYFRKQEPLH